MYRVVIIDDEPVIVEGLAKTVHWEKWNCRVCGTAYDGRQGLELIRMEKPNIIVTDISMPEMNGLAMVAGISSEFPETRIAILTGYRDFDYAKEAIRLGVDRFLLKPSRMEELEEAIGFMTGKLQEHGIMPLEEGKEQMTSEKGGELFYDSTANSFIVKNAISYIQEHYREKLRLIDVAEQIYVSQWHLSKLLNKHTGKNFSEILNGIRIEKARELLHDPGMRVCDVAEEVGFVDLPHFSRVFKAHEGVSANEYRNQL